MADIILIQLKSALQKDLTCLSINLLLISWILVEEGYKIKFINQIINKRWRIYGT